MERQERQRATRGFVDGQKTAKGRLEVSLVLTEGLK